MVKYFINKEEVTEDEFNAELRAQVHAYYDENFDEILAEFSDNRDETFFIGHYEFDLVELFKILPQEMQEDIEEFLLESLTDGYFFNVEVDGEVYVELENEVIHFEMIEIEE